MKQLYPISFAILLHCKFSDASIFGWSYNFENESYCSKQEVSTQDCKKHVNLYASSLTSEDTVITYGYDQFDFCHAADDYRANFDHPEFTPYKIDFLRNTTELLCIKSYNFNDGGESEKKLNRLRKGIRLHYQHNWIIDHIPVTLCYERGMKFCSLSFPMGSYSSDRNGLGDNLIEQEATEVPNFHYILYNHVDIQITYVPVEDKYGQYSNVIGHITSVKVIPQSMNSNDFVINFNVSGYSPPLEIPNGSEEYGSFKINYTYSVSFVRDATIKWSQRWDRIIASMSYSSNAIKFFTLHSMVVALILLLSVLTVITTAYKDIRKFNELQSEKKSQEVCGWMLIQGDVFRRPNCLNLLSAFLGSGMQLFLTAVIFLALRVLFTAVTEVPLTPELDKENFTTFVILTFSFLGAPAAYISAKIHESFDGKKWWKTFLLISLLTPGIMFSTFFAANTVLWAAESSAAISIYYATDVIKYWLFLLIPLAFIGSLRGIWEQGIKYPVVANPIPRQTSHCNMCKNFFGIALGGVLPFGCIFVHLFFIQNALWSSQAYLTYDYLLISFATLTVVCAAVSILLCYYQIRHEDYNWCWRSFLATGSTGIYVLLYCVYYFFTKLDFKDIYSVSIYFIYSFLMAFLAFLVTGSIGFFASYWFLKNIYRKVSYYSSRIFLIRSEWGNSEHVSSYI